MIPTPLPDPEFSHQAPDRLGNYGERLLLRTREAAEICGVSVSLMSQLLAKGDIPSVLIGRARRVRRVDLELWVTERLAKPR